MWQILGGLLKVLFDTFLGKSKDEKLGEFKAKLDQYETTISNMKQLDKENAAINKVNMDTTIQATEMDSKVSNTHREADKVLDDLTKLRTKLDKLQSEAIDEINKYK